MKLRKEGKITTLNTPFKTSNKQEIDNLIGRGIFIFEQYDPVKHDGVRIFKSRLVREIKGKLIDALYEKSRLVIQDYQYNRKETIFTQFSTL